MKLIDLHCDTALSLYHKKASFRDADGHISLEKASFLDKYIQLMAFFTSSKLSDSEGWEVFLAAHEHLLRQCDECGIPLIRTAAELEAFERSDAKVGFVLTIEDVRILDGKIERVKELYDLGIRVVTPLWGGPTTIGGSHDTDMGLTDFGREAVREMLRYGIVQDISHASFNSAFEILDLCEEAGRAPIATHMNSYTVRPHSRNMRDDELEKFLKLGGIAGVSFCPPHLTGDNPCTTDHVVDHFRFYQEHAAGHVCFGSDYDGTDLPVDLADITGVPAIVDKIRAFADDAAIEDITWNTAYAFLKNNLPK